MRINVTCPECKRAVRKQSEADELTIMVSTEDEDGRIVYYHWECWKAAMRGK